MKHLKLRGKSGNNTFFYMFLQTKLIKIISFIILLIIKNLTFI